MRSITVFFCFIFVVCAGALAQTPYQKMGQKALMDGNFKLAVAHLEKAMATDSNDVNTLYMLGYSYYHSDRYKNAVSAFSRLVSLRPNETSAYYYRGKAKNIMATETPNVPNTEREKLLLSAIRDFSKAIELNGDDAKFYQNRAIAYRDYGILKGQKIPKFYDKTKATGALRSCIVDFQKVLELSPGRKDITAQLEDARDHLQNLK